MHEMNALPIPITVITGFLGSGKTTLLSSLLKKQEMTNTAVIINEFGEVGLDHSLIEHSDENIIELQNGCICCTIRGDLKKTLLDLLRKKSEGEIEAFNRVVIETTGLADPVPIIHTLISSFDLQKSYLLDGVITLVDAVNGENTLSLQEEAVKQAAMAERIIITKTDLVDRETKESLIKRLSLINPSIKIISSNFGEVSIPELLGFGAYDPYSKSKDVTAWLAAEEFETDHHHHHQIDVNRHDDRIQAFSITTDEPVNAMAFAFFRDLLTANMGSDNMGSDLLRLKGIINIVGKDFPAVIHGVQHIFHPVQWLDSWPDKDRRTRLVFITRNIKKDEIEKFFNALLGIVKDKGMETVIDLVSNNYNASTSDKTDKTEKTDNTEPDGVFTQET